MRRFSRTVDINARASRVWDVIADVERWPEWTASMTSVQRLDSGPLAIGSRARVKQPKLAASKWVVTAVEHGRGFTWVSRSPGIESTGYHYVQPTPSGSRATLSIEFRGILAPLVASLWSSLITRYVEMEAAGLKRRSEGG